MLFVLGRVINYEYLAGTRSVQTRGNNAVRAQIVTHQWHAWAQGFVALIRSMAAWPEDSTGQHRDGLLPGRGTHPPNDSDGRRELADALAITA